jgi:hypothetical protein
MIRKTEYTHIWRLDEGRGGGGSHHHEIMLGLKRHAVGVQQAQNNNKT